MGREIRRVPLYWEHPKEEKYNYQTSQYEDRFIPKYDEPYSKAAKEWMADYALWLDGKHPNFQQDAYYWDAVGTPPYARHYLPDFEGMEMGYCLYETVSEGTPVSPVFATKELLAEYLAEHGDFWDQKRGHGGWSIERAMAFCESGWAPSFIMGENTGLVEGKLFVPLPLEVSE